MHEEVKTIFEESFTSILSQLYMKLCDCRKNYPELEDIVDPRFHLEECEYRIALDRIGFIYA